MHARRLIPLGAGVTALLVVAGIASHGRPLSSGSGSGPSASFFDYVATTIFLLGIAVLVVALLGLADQRPGVGAARRGRWSLVSAFAMFAACGLIAWGLSNSRFEERLRQLRQRTPTQGQTAPPAQAHGQPKHPRGARLRWDEVAIVLALITGVGAYVFVTRTRRRALRPLARGRRAVSQALEESIDDLRDDPDVRRAIIAAYARMERALAAVGLPRRASEAPFEYLERSLVELDAGAEGARRLTDLFERAKFSQHEPGEPMRDEAIDALLAVRDDLRRPAAQPVVA